MLWGAPVVVALLLYLLVRGSSDGSRPSPEPVANDLSPTIVEPVPAPIVAAPPVVVAPPAPPVPSVNVSQLKLVGLFSRGALIAMADGSQHFVRVGREIVPGVTLARVEVHQAVLATAAGEVRLGFDAGTPPDNAVVAAPPALTPPRP